jgi:hypothetical protein
MADMPVATEIDGRPSLAFLVFWPMYLMLREKGLTHDVALESVVEFRRSEQAGVPVSWDTLGDAYDTFAEIADRKWRFGDLEDNDG